MILSNVDNANIAGTVAGALGGAPPFAGVYTAEDIGSYKPDERNFRYLIRKAEELGVDVEAGELLHVGVGLHEDMVNNVPVLVPVSRERMETVRTSS
jgi:FMN phosphatase YigB (HAD superfamily)